MKEREALGSRAEVGRNEQQPMASSQKGWYTAGPTALLCVLDFDADLSYGIGAEGTGRPRGLPTLEPWFQEEVRKQA